jgi:hypothetical protein
MRIKEILKRSYFALTSIVLFLVLLNGMPLGVTYHRKFFCLSYGFSGFLMVLGIAAFCWFMSRNNGRCARKWYIAAIPIGLYLLRHLIVGLLKWWARSQQVFVNIYTVDAIFLVSLILCVATITFIFLKRYDNILPKQNKAALQVIKWLFIVGQIFIWLWFVWILPEFIEEWGWWPDENFVNETINSMNQEFDAVFNENGALPDSTKVQ